MQDIHTIAATGQSINASMRCRQPVISWDDILILGKQLDCLPLLNEDTVVTQTVIGPKAKQPLVIDTPILISHMSFGCLSKEAAIAFSEIPQIAANYYHVLDVRHGPMVLVDEKTLAVVALSPEEYTLQRDLIRDLKGRGAKVVTISHTGADWGSDWQVDVPRYANYGVAGIPFIFIPQAVGLYKALNKGLNPDLPAGLEPMIDLGN